MTTIKHNFSSLNTGTNDIFTNLFVEVNTATSNLLGSSILLVLFIVLFGIFVRRTQDVAKSFVTSLHINLIIAIVLYYWGKIGGFIGIHDSVLLSMIILEIGMVAYLKYNRSDQL